MSWIAFEFLLLALGWLGIGFFKGYIEQKDYAPEISQGGGLIFSILFFGLLLVLIYYKMVMPFYFKLLAPLFFISVVAFLEDRQRISSNFRLFIQVVGLYLSYYFIDFDLSHFNLIGFNVGELVLNKMPHWACLSLLILGVVAFTSMWDRMDKTAGFAAVQSIFVFGIGGFVLSSVTAYNLAILFFGLSALLGGFLIWNWPVAKIMMGKSGTIFLGSLISIVALYTYQWYRVPVEIWLILMSPFLVDASLTASRRLLALVSSKSNSVVRSDNHAYERLLTVGWSPSQLLYGLIVLNSLLVVLVWWAYMAPAFLTQITAAAFSLVLIIYGFIEYTKPMYANWYKSMDSKLTAEV